jgi:hypothetical protein
MSYKDYVNQITQNIGQSPRDRSIDDSFRGLNINGRNSAISLNTENHGYTFFTRPLMNLSYDNAMVDRRLSTLLNENPRSIERMIRSYLDPRAHQQGLECPGVDPLNPFIPLLSNNLINLTGWEDFTLNATTTTPGVYRDAMSYVDDVPYQYNTYDLQATFRNIAGDPITYLFYMWEIAMGLSREGRTLPYPDLLFLNEMDYNTRIYRLVMDATKTFVTRIGACGAAFPLNAPTGQILNFTGDGSETPYQTTNDQLNFSFRCMGMTVYDHILIYEFNDLVETFNPLMTTKNRTRLMVKLKQWEKRWFNFQAYPYINGATMELEWWVTQAVYDAQSSGNFSKGPTSKGE